MTKKSTLRTRIIFWYSLIVAISLGFFGFYIYISVAHLLHENIKNSLVEVTKSLSAFIEDSIIQQSKETNNIGQPDRDDQQSDEVSNRIIDTQADSLHYSINSKAFLSRLRALIRNNPLFNTKNYYIQIADTSNNVLWKTRNTDINLPMFPPVRQRKRVSIDSLKNITGDYNFLPKYIFKHNINYVAGDTAFATVLINHTPSQIFLMKTPHAQITIGYHLTDVKIVSDHIMRIIYIALPIILIFSALGGWLLSAISLKPIDKLIGTANEISEKNLSLRLPYSAMDDEVGRLAKTLNSVFERLENSFNQIRQFTFDASHELKTPLTILRGELELSLVANKSENYYLKTIASALDEVIRLSNVVETLLELSRADLGRVKMNFAKKSLSKLMIDIAEDAEILADHKDIKVDFNIAPNIEAHFDTVRMHQAILNVLDNAIKYTDVRGHIWIELRTDKGFADIVIRDNGHGIPENELPKIFDRFYRVDKSRATTIAGSGLGLSIVDWIVKSHYGKIYAYSKVGEGTEISIRIPIDQDY